MHPYSSLDLLPQQCYKTIGFNEYVVFSFALIASQPNDENLKLKTKIKVFALHFGGAEPNEA